MRKIPLTKVFRKGYFIRRMEFEIKRIFTYKTFIFVLTVNVENAIIRERRKL